MYRKNIHTLKLLNILYLAYIIMDYLKNHILFTEAPQIKELCRPLTSIDIDGFIFMRRFTDGRFIDHSK